MSEPPSASVSVPTLTEVVRAAAPSTTAPAVGDPTSARVAKLDQAVLVERVLSALQAQLQPSLEGQLRAALAPALTRAAEQLVHELRLEMARCLREWVASAVAQELARIAAGEAGQS